MSGTRLDQSGEIFNSDGESVGWLNYTDNRLRNLEIDPDHRQNGHGTSAVEQFLDLCRKRGYDRIRVCCVVNDFMGAIVVQHDFEVANPEEETTNKDYFIWL